MLRALSVADDWWAMQGYGEAKLPAWLTIGSETLTLQLAATAVVVTAILLALGWRTRAVTAAAWLSACAFQYAARGTADYHNAVLCVLLFWSLALPTATVVSLDARAGRQPRLPQWLVTTAGVGLILSLAWIYLSTAAVKTGSAWWQEGSAVWLVLLDRGTPTAPGRWLAGAAPSGIWPTLTHDPAHRVRGAPAHTVATKSRIRRPQPRAVPPGHVAPAGIGKFSPGEDRRRRRPGAE